MSTVPLSYRATIYDLQTKSSREVFLDGEAYITGYGIGGGPMPPGQGGDGGKPPGIWGPTDPRPNPPIANVPGAPGYKPPGIWGPTDPRPNPPIAFPPGWVGGVPPELPPGVTVPEPPPPGSPTTAVPGNWPVQPVTPPAYMIVQYPGVGPVVVAPPAPTAPAPTA